MSGLFPAYILREVDNAGRPLSNGLIWTYKSGTTIPKPVYMDAALTVPWTNPVVLDASGSADIFLGEGAYGIQVQSSTGTNIRNRIDGITAGSGGSSINSNATSAYVKTYNDLRALQDIPDTVYVAGNLAEGDGGAGQFQLIPGSSLSDDGGVILTSGSGTNVYKRVYDYAINPEWYGVRYGVSTNQYVAFNAATAGSAAWNSPVAVTGSIYLTQNVTVPSGAEVQATIDGYFVSNAPITMTFLPGSKFSAEYRTFSETVNPKFGYQVAPTVNLSWMAGTSADDRLIKFLSAVAAGNVGQTLFVDESLSTSLTSLGYNGPLVFSPTEAITFATGTASIELSFPGIQESGYQMLVIPTTAGNATLDFGTAYARPEWFGPVAAGADDSRRVYYALVSGKTALSEGKTYSVQTALLTLPATVEIQGFGTIAFSNGVQIATTNLRIQDATVTTATAVQWANVTNFEAYQATLPSLYTASVKVVDGVIYSDRATAPNYDGTPSLFNAYLPLIPNARSLETDSLGKIYASPSFKYDLNNWNCVGYFPHYEASGIIGFTVEYPTTGGGYIWALSSRGRSDRSATTFRRVAGDVDGVWFEQHIPVPAQLVAASGWQCQGFKAIGSLYIMFVKSFAGANYLLTVWSSLTPFDANSWTLRYQGAQVANNAITWDFDYIARDGSTLYASAGSYSPGVTYKVASDGTVTTQNGGAPNTMSIIGYDYDNHKILASASISSVSNFGISSNAGLTWTWYPIADANLYGAAHCYGTLYSISGFKPSWSIPGYWTIDTTSGTPYFVDVYVKQASTSNIGILRAAKDSIIAVAPGNPGIILAGPRNGNGLSQKYCPYTTGYIGGIEYNDYYAEALLGASNNMILSSI